MVYFAASRVEAEAAWGLISPIRMKKQAEAAPHRFKFKNSKG